VVEDVEDDELIGTEEVGVAPKANVE